MLMYGYYALHSFPEIVLNSIVIVINSVNSYGSYM